MREFTGIINFIRDLYSEKTEFIPLHAPVFTGNERKYTEECIDSTFVSSAGMFVDEFEKLVAAYTGSAKAVACVNGTNALHLALLLSDVTPHSEVITQPLTFVATANAITYCGAHPVFLDVDADTLGLSPASLENWLQKHTTRKFDSTIKKDVLINIHTGRKISACLPVHTYGLPCRIDELVEICGKYRLNVVEDAAESMGSFYRNRHTGTFGNIGVLSFNGNKILTTGGGGMLIFQNEELAKRAKHLTTQAKISHPWEFDHDLTGYNYRLPNINAALGLAQLENLEKFVESKRRIALSYHEYFQSLGIRYSEELPFSKSNYWLNCIMLSDKNERDHFLEISNRNGVMTRPAWKLMNDLPMYKDCETDALINSRQISETLVNLPSSVRLSDMNK